MQTPRYILSIDEEGFPSFDGIRVDDADFISGLFENFYRIDPANYNSALITRCEGEVVFVDAFEAPLVAQSIEDFSEDASTWVFPGQWKKRVPHADVFVDDWHRLKTRIGTIKVNATLSRKAQAEFGKYWSHLGRSVSFAPWHRVDPSKTVREEAFWESAYREKRDGWEMREVTPVLKSELPKLLKKIPMQNELCVVPGCGRGHDAEWIAQNSQMKVVGVDFAESAEREFEKFYPGSRASFQRADVFDYLGSIPEKASLIIEHTLFCAIDPALRKKYLEKVFGALKKGGMLAGVFWMRPNPDGPPFGFTPWELRELLSPFSVDVLDWHLSFDSWEGRRGQEYFVVLQKK